MSTRSRSGRAARVSGRGVIDLASERSRREARRARAACPVPLLSPAAVHHAVQDLVGSDPREHFLALLLDGRNRLAAIETVSIGTAQASLVHPREVFRAAIAHTAPPICALILAHTHPSGDPTPSAEDREVTDRLRSAGKMLGIEVLDHVICAESGFVSMRESEGWRDA